MSKTITPEQAIAALETLSAYGRQRYREEVQAEIGHGQAIGGAIGGLINGGNVDHMEVDEAHLTAELLEDGNMHIPAGIIRALAGDSTQGTATVEHTDDGPRITIQLSESYK